MATKRTLTRMRGILPLYVAGILAALLTGCAGENKDQPPVEKTATPAPTFDKSGKPMQGPPPAMR